MFSLSQEVDGSLTPVDRALTWTESWLRRDFEWTAALGSAAVVAVIAFIYLRPGVFVVSTMPNDTLLYTESGYRVAHGQLPGIDFTSALGILAFLPHALAYRLTGDLVEAIPASSVMLAAVVLGIAIYFALTRLRALVGLGATVTTSLLVMAPVVFNVGFWEGEATFTTIAMSYNRLGFTLVLLTGLLPIKPKPQWRMVTDRFDPVIGIILFAIAYYTKMPFGIAVACLVAFYGLLLQPGWRQLSMFVIGVATVILAMEIVLPGINVAYFKEMALASAVDGNIHGQLLIRDGASTARENLMLGGLPLTAMLAVGEVDSCLIAFYVCLMGGSVVLLSQCAQGNYLIAPLAVSIAAASIILNTEGHRNRLAFWVVMVVLSYGFSTYMVPPLLAIGKHAVMAAHTAPTAGLPQAYASLRIPMEQGVNLEKLDAAFSGKITAEEAFTSARMNPIDNSGNVVFASEYIHTLVRLVVARDLCGGAADSAAILDFANASSSLFGYSPVGGYAYANFGRSFDTSAYVAPQRMFKNVNCLLDPKLPFSPNDHAGLWSTYGPYLTRTFDLSGETDFWRVFVRRHG